MCADLAVLGLVSDLGSAPFLGVSGGPEGFARGRFESFELFLCFFAV